MFTIKYRQGDGTEFITGPFESVIMEQSEEHPGSWVVRGLQNKEGGQFQAGPVFAAAKTPEQPTVWVMNEQGATVARYLL